jgi:hypothetical protein
VVVCEVKTFQFRKQDKQKAQKNKQKAQRKFFVTCTAGLHKEDMVPTEGID